MKARTWIERNFLQYYFQIIWMRLFCLNKAKIFLMEYEIIKTAAFTDLKFFQLKVSIWTWKCNKELPFLVQHFRFNKLFAMNGKLSSESFMECLWTRKLHSNSVGFTFPTFDTFIINQFKSHVIKPNPIENCIAGLRSNSFSICDWIRECWEYIAAMASVKRCTSCMCCIPTNNTTFWPIK